MPDQITAAALIPTLARGTVLIDARSPSEFAKAHVPGAINLPLMNDEERHRVGLCYKEAGPDAAVALGHSLVGGAVKEARVSAWLDAIRAAPADAVIYCARGGLRSQITQRWIAEAGVDLPLVQGGYKALRHHLMRLNDTLSERAELRVVAGRTGSGKTRVIVRSDNALDLEAAANHRGSAFGRHVEPQPPQATFENRLALDTLALDLSRPVVVEDESRNIGSVHLSQPMIERIKSAPVVMLEVPFEDRIGMIHEDYVLDLQAEYRRHFGDAGADRYQAYLEGALERIRRRLGGELHQRILGELRAAMVRQRTTGDSESHRVWIASLLAEYYDRMYDYQLHKAPRPVLFQGDIDAVVDYLNTAR